MVNIFRKTQEEIGNVRKYHPVISEIKHSVDNLHCRIGMLKERRSNLDQMDELSKTTTTE